MAILVHQVHGKNQLQQSDPQMTHHHHQHHADQSKPFSGETELIVFNFLKDLVLIPSSSTIGSFSLIEGDDELLEEMDGEEEEEEEAGEDPEEDGDRREEKVACVTSASSYLGLAVVKQLLARGYSVVALVDRQEDVERLRREMEAFQPAATEGGGKNGAIVAIKWVDLADGNDGVQSLYDAFNGCHVVFHLSSFIDPSGLSGYSKPMVEVEVKATKNVMEASARTPTVSKCVLTSSLLACIWRVKPHVEATPLTIDHRSWSQEQFCQDKKLWYALGKLKAEKEAWRIAKEKKTAGLRLATICPALITGPDYACRNPTPTIAYLKAYQEMYTNGLLAAVDVARLAQAHVYACELMKKTAGWFQRYLCFDRVIQSLAEVEEMSRETGITFNEEGLVLPSRGNLYHLSNAKLTRLVSSRRRCYSK